MPATPKGGIKPYPKINNGFKNIFKKKFKINIFLYVTVSPSACSKEFNATKIINAIEPLNTTFVYSRLSERTCIFRSH